MSPKYKLTYFDVKALGEGIRMLFAYKGIEYEDIRLTFDQWPDWTGKMPWGVLPVLEVDGKELSQSGAIMSYLGKKFGLGGKDEWETAKCEEYHDAIVDIRTEIVKFSKEEDAKRIEEIKRNLETCLIPKTWGKFNQILKENGSGWLIGDGITYADIFLAFNSEYLTACAEFKKMDNYPELLKHQERVLSLPGIKEWIEKRPVTEF